jgi:hypothetical protein
VCERENQRESERETERKDGNRVRRNNGEAKTYGTTKHLAGRGGSSAPSRLAEYLRVEIRNREQSKIWSETAER